MIEVDEAELQCQTQPTGKGHAIFGKKKLNILFLSSHNPK